MRPGSLIVFVTVLFLLAVSPSVDAGPGGKMAFQGFLRGSDSSELTDTVAMRFGIYFGGMRVWYAEYSEVEVVASWFSVLLGDEDQGGRSLDPLFGETLSDRGPQSLLIRPELFGNLYSTSEVEIEVEIYNGQIFEVLTPRIQKASTLFAIRAESIGGLTASELVRFNEKGEILSAQGKPLLNSRKLMRGAIRQSARSQEPLLRVSCSDGLVAVSGGGSCGGKNASIQKSCPCDGPHCRGCARHDSLTSYWLLKCIHSDEENEIYVTCIESESSKSSRD